MRIPSSRHSLVRQRWVRWSPVLLLGIWLSPGAQETAEPPVDAGPAATGDGRCPSLPTLPSLAGLIRDAAPALVAIEGRDGSLGSGFVVDTGGLIVTNRHLIGEQRTIRVRRSGGVIDDARVVDTHEAADLALIEIDAETPLPALALTRARDPEVGDWVVALGNPFGLGPTASIGIIGAEGASLARAGIDADLIQTDAAIHPGNSGGPLLDLHGRVVGVVSARIGPGSGIGFAIPTRILEAMLKDWHGRSP